MTMLPQDANALVLPGSGDRLWLWPTLMGPAADDLLEVLTADLPWQQPTVHLFGRHHPIPRLQCWMGDPEARYRYSGLSLVPVTWHPRVAQLRARVEAVTGRPFNGVLLNLYRHGDDRMGWHADDEPELGPAPWVASYSLGAERRLAFRPRGASRTAGAVALPHDSLLLMAPEVQHHWQHAVPATRRVAAPRLSMTFRLIQPR